MPLPALGVYITIARDKEAKKRQRWSAAVDQRMSTISEDLKSLSGAAASHVVRQPRRFRETGRLGNMVVIVVEMTPLTPLQYSMCTLILLIQFESIIRLCGYIQTGLSRCTRGSEISSSKI